jgi:hypothetical protein
LTMHIQWGDGIGEVLMIGDHTMRGIPKIQCIASSLFTTFFQVFTLICKPAALVDFLLVLADYRLIVN